MPTRTTRLSASPLPSPNSSKMAGLPDDLDDGFLALDAGDDAITFIAGSQALRLWDRPMSPDANCRGNWLGAEVISRDRKGAGCLPRLLRLNR